MGKVIAVAQHKGGTGKTVTCVNLGAALAEIGRKVLLVDVDPQASLTISFGISPPELDQSIYNVLADPECSLEEIIMEGQPDGVFVAPSHIDLAAADLEFAGQIGREKKLAKVLSPFKDQYDYTLLDCGPTLNLLAVNALTAADSVLIPIQCELLSVYGLSHLLKTIDVIREELNQDLSIEGFVLTMYDARTIISERVVENIRARFGDQVFQSIIRRRVKLAEGPASGTPIIVHAPRSDGAKDYRELARELDENEQET